MAFGNPITRFAYNNGPMRLRNLMVSTYSKSRGRLKFGRRFDANLADLQVSQWYSQEEISCVQSHKLRLAINHASRFVPFYTEAFSSLGIHPNDIRSRADLQTLPIIDKASVQGQLDRFRSALFKDPRTVDILHSSGTTGKAIDVCVDRDYFSLEKAFLWLQRSWCGLKVGDRTAYFTGHPILPISRKRPPFWVFDNYENRTMFSLQHMSRQNLPSFADELERFRPELIVGYPTAIYLMATYLEESGRTGIRPRGIFTGSESLFPHQRQTIERCFGCKVLDLYGMTEYCGMVMQCEAGNYHVQEEYGVLEILNRDGTETKVGEVGEIVCTGLNNMAMPLLRYRTGDTAIRKAGRCACGRCGALIERITGRMEDIVVTPDGRYLSRLDFVFKEMPGVQEAQLIQESADTLRIRYVASNGLSQADQHRLLSNLRERIGDRMKLEFERVDHIPRLPNGKFRYVVSKVPLHFAGAQQVGELLETREQEASTL